MIVEVVAVGTELLLGQIVNGNAAHIGAALAASGFDAHHQQVVGDNVERIARVLETAMGRSDAVIVTGGIGPTRDDLTREALCEATGREMRFDEGYASLLRERFESAGREMPASNLRQAEHPDGAELIVNPAGTAPALVIEHAGTVVFAVPGVPSEMAALLRDEVLPRLRRRSGVDRVVASRIIRSWGLGEARVGEMLDDLYMGSTNPSVAFLASDGEIKVRVTAGAETLAAARRLIAPVETEIVRRLGSHVFGFDDDAIEAVLVRGLAERGWTLGTAESATGGMVAGRLTSVAGASTVFRGAVVAYDAVEKGRLLGVPPDVLVGGLVTEATAAAMAEGARAALEVDVAVAVTGAAGPDQHDGRRAGTMIVAVATPEGLHTRTLRLPGDRERVRSYATTAALQLTRMGVSGAWWET